MEVVEDSQEEIQWIAAFRTGSIIKQMTQQENIVLICRFLQG